MLVNYKLADGKVIQVEVNEEVAKFLQEDKQKHWKQNKQEKHNLSIEAIEEQGDQLIDETAQSPEDIVLEKEAESETAIRHKKVNDAIAKLDERQQQMVRAYYFEHKTQQEIADELGISYVAVYYAMKIILKKMKVFLKNDLS